MVLKNGSFFSQNVAPGRLLRSQCTHHAHMGSTNLTQGVITLKDINLGGKWSVGYLGDLEVGSGGWIRPAYIVLI